MSTNQDLYTFQYGELKKGPTYALAMAKVTDNFVQSSFKSTPNYTKLLLSVFHHLSTHPSMTDPILQTFETALMARQNTVLKEERDNDKDRKKFTFEKRANGRDPNEDSSSDDEEVTEEQLAARKLAEEEEEKRKEQEWIKAQERYAALQQQKKENEERLRAQARRVDAEAFERQLQSRGAVLVNPGLTAVKGNKSGSKGGKLNAEEAAQLKEEVAGMMKEKERLDAVLHTSGDDLSTALEEAKKSLAEFEAKAAAVGDTEASSKELSKGEATQWKQKLAKHTLDRNRLALQLKAMDADSTRDELLSVLAHRDTLALKVERAESALAASK